jgi:hypothetical protein
MFMTVDLVTTRPIAFRATWSPLSGQRPERVVEALAVLGQ